MAWSAPIPAGILVMFSTWKPFFCPPTARVYGESTQNLAQRMAP